MHSLCFQLVVHVFFTLYKNVPRCDIYQPHQLGAVSTNSLCLWCGKVMNGLALPWEDCLLSGMPAALFITHQSIKPPSRLQLSSPALAFARGAPAVFPSRLCGSVENHAREAARLLAPAGFVFSPILPLSR